MQYRSLFRSGSVILTIKCQWLLKYIRVQSRGSKVSKASETKQNSPAAAIVFSHNYNFSAHAMTALDKYFGNLLKSYPSAILQVQIISWGCQSTPNQNRVCRWSSSPESLNGLQDIRGRSNMQESEATGDGSRNANWIALASSTPPSSSHTRSASLSPCGRNMEAREKLCRGGDAPLKFPPSRFNSMHGAPSLPLRDDSGPAMGKSIVAATLRSETPPPIRKASIRSRQCGQKSGSISSASSKSSKKRGGNGNVSIGEALGREPLDSLLVSRFDDMVDSSRIKNALASMAPPIPTRETK